MRARKIGLLLLILGFGGTVETAWFVENRFDVGPSGCRVLRGRFYGPSFSFEDQQRYPVPAGAALEVRNAFGAVRVKKGEPGQVQVLLRKVVFRRTEEEARAFAQGIRLNGVEDGKTLRLSTNRGELEQGPEHEQVGFETHLEVVVPPETAVMVENEHGEVEVVDAARADVKSSFDTVRVARISGAVTVDARHGEVEVGEVGGDLTLSNRHGRVGVRDVKGQTRVDAEHGDVSVTNVGAAVVSAAHGDVDVQTVRGNLEVTAQHAQVTASEVMGEARLETSYQSLQARQVKGQVRVKVQHGAVELADLEGPAQVEASFGDVKLERVAGPVEVTVEHGGVEAEAIAHGARIKASGGEVVLEGFAGPVEVEVERAGARLVPAGALAAPVTVRTRHGGIELDVPPGSRIALEAIARQGEIELDVPGLTLERSQDEGGADRVTGRLGDGANLVKLESEHGGVHLRAPAAVAQKP
jgi:DUF4097 and DUF4098 domain-containing protein YvlB